MSRDLIGEVLLDQFRVETFIASGGMATIYRVWDLQRSVPLAMKVLHPDLADDPAFISRFQREADSLELLVHPHIVPFYGLYQSGDLSFLLERYIDGPSLDEVLRKRAGRPLPLGEALIYFKALYTSLGYAHAQGIIHCDVKPGNVLIDQGGSVYLTDFGIARFADSSGATSSALGTPLYMAPEQIRGEPVVAQTDVYSLGALMFELLTGRRPFLGDGDIPPGVGSGISDRIRYQHLNQPPPDPRSLNANLPDGVARILLTALAKDPRERYPSVQAMASAIVQVVSARFETLPDRVRLPDELRREPAWPPLEPLPLDEGDRPQEEEWFSPPGSTLSGAPPERRPYPASLSGRPAGDARPSLFGLPKRWLVALGAIAVLALCGLLGFTVLRAFQSGAPGFPGRATQSAGLPVTTRTAAPSETPDSTATGQPAAPSPTPGPTEEQTPDLPVDGTVAIVRRFEGRDRLFLFDLASGEHSALALVPNVQVELSHAPQWSPDGARLTWMSRYDGRMHIVAMDLAEGEPYQLPAGEAYGQVSSPSFLGDGQRISFWATNAEGNWLVIADAASGESIEQVQLPEYRNLFVWNWNNSLLAFARGSASQAQVVVSGSAATAERPIETGGSEYAPAWSRDGQWLAFQSDAGREPGQNEIWIGRSDGSGLRQVTGSPDGTWSRAPSWSPDGRWIAFVSNRSGSLGADHGELFVVEVETGQVTRLTDTGGQVYDWRPAWRP